MSLNTWLRQLANGSPRRTIRPTRRPNGSIRGKSTLFLEYLEDRLAPASTVLLWTGQDAALSGQSANLNWSDANNWVMQITTQHAVPVSGDTIVFSSNQTNNPSFAGAFTSIDDISGLTLNGIVLDTTSFTLNGFGVNINNTDQTLTSGITNLPGGNGMSAGTNVIAMPISVTSAAIFENDAGTLNLTNPGGINIAGGPLTVSGNTNIAGPVSGGILHFLSQSTISAASANGALQFNSGATLEGTGTVGSLLSVGRGAVVQPGTPGTPGALTTNNGTTFGAGSAYNVQLGGTTAGSYDSINNTGGTVTLTPTVGTITGTTLGVSLISPFTLAQGQTFTIITGGTNAVVGTFAGLPENSVFNAAGAGFKINYNVDPTHNVVLTAEIPGPATHFSITPSATTTAVGTTVTMTLTALDAGNFVASTFPATATITSTTDPQALMGILALPQTVALVPSGTGAGTATFPIIFRTVGQETVTATNATITGDSSANPVTVTVGATNHFVLSVMSTYQPPGVPIYITVIAEDQYNNPTAFNYIGTVHFSSAPIGVESFTPNDVMLTNGQGVFSATLTSYFSTVWITAADVLSPGINGTVIVNQPSPHEVSYFTVSAPQTTQTTGVGFPVTVTAKDFIGNTFPSYQGAVNITSSDPLFVPVIYWFVAGDNGVHTFPSVVLKTAGSQTITATQSSAPLDPRITGTSSAITVRGLVVTSLTPTPTGFKVAFSKPVATSNVTLYGPGAAMQDVALLGTVNGASNGPVGGSLIFDSTGMNAEFKATANTLNVFNGLGAPVLLDDQYTVTLVSGVSNGFSDGTAGLDGGGGIGGNGGHANFVFKFPATGTTHYQSQAVLALPDFARGPSDTVTLQAPIIGSGVNAAGIPITLYNAAGVTDVTFTLTYNPSLFVLNATSTSTIDSTGTGAKTFTLTTSSTGTATFHYTNTVAQTAGALILGDILATDPSSSKTSYGVKDLMTLSASTVNGSPFSGVYANGIHVNTYIGDVSGDGRIDAVDVAKMAVVSAAAPGVDTGFIAYELLDPAIVGDVTNDISVDAGDLSTLKGFLLHLSAPLMSTPPGLTGIVSPSAVDPIVSLASAAQTHNGIFSVPVMLDHPHPKGSTGVSEAVLALTYDPSVLNVSASDITMGSLPDKDWQLITDVDARTGQIGIQLFSMTPLTATQGGSLVNIAFHLLPGATVDSTAVQLVDSVAPNGQQYGTALADDQSGLVLSPGIDRVIINTVVAPAFQTNMATPMRAGQVFQLGNAPELKSLLCANSPYQMAADLLFLALARGKDALAELNSPSLSSDNLWDAAAQHPDWQMILGKSSSPGARTDFLAGWPSLHGAVQQPVWDPIGIMDRVFAAFGEERDDAGEN